MALHPRELVERGTARRHRPHSLCRACGGLAANTSRVVERGDEGATSRHCHERDSTSLSQSCASLSRVQPSGPGAQRLLPGAVAVDTNDPFHSGLGGAMASVGMALSRALGSHMSESSCKGLQDVFAQLCSQEVLKALFGNALKPTAGVGCKPALDDLMAACRLYLEPPTLEQRDRNKKNESGSDLGTPALPSKR